VFQTNYVEKGYDQPVPTYLRVELTGKAPDMPQAVAAFMGWAAPISSVLAVCSNAAMGQLETELVFDASPENEQHEFLQSYVPEWPLVPVPGRRIDVEVVNRVLNALAAHEKAGRISRAIAQYSEALSFLRPGREVSCLAHLYRGVEALSPAILRQHEKKLSKTREQLAADWGVDGKRFENEARLRLIFDGDAECFEKARKASDAFEHGFLDYDAVRSLVKEVLRRTAGYLRRAIFRTLELNEDIISSRLCDGNYSVPRGPLLLVRYLRGQMIGKIEDLAAEGQQYPICEMQFPLATVLIGENRAYGFGTDIKVTPNIGEKAQFRLQRFETWDGSTIKEEATDQRQILELARSR